MGPPYRSAAWTGEAAAGRLEPGRVEHQPAARYTAGMADARLGAFRLTMGPVPPFR
jgi:hypothetical protein